MRYVVIEAFCDMQDGDREYAPGDIYPKYQGLADEARIKELASAGNKLGRPLIKAIGVEKPKSVEPERPEKPEKPVESTESVEPVKKTRRRGIK